ncbi:ankyrin repeat-containing domain protein [Tricladium varicosporioides]|nr:ankyrin repeat-containing domain protein [Hymenoscyphus varicosporioides]
MDLLDFPVDLIHKVLFYAAISRGVKRALRLGLVCKTFYNCLQPALFESRLLDEFGVELRYHDLAPMETWYIRRHYGAEKLWQSYLVYRVQSETDPKIGRFVEIRRVAEDLCRQTDAKYEATVNALCWLALERGACYPGYQWCWKRGYRANEAPNPGLNLLSAAAYFNYIALARQLLSDGHCPTRENQLFPSPIQLAAWAGNANMLRLFQEHLPDFEEIPPRDFADEKNWRGKTGPDSVKGAVLSGDMDMVRLAVYPPSRSTSNNTDFSGQPFGHVDPRSLPGYDLQLTLFCAKTWEVLQYIDSFFEESMLSSDLATLLLARYAELGNVEIVQQLLDAGVDIYGGDNHNRNPLVIAARFCHENVVDLLLDRGADPNNDNMQQRGTPLSAAVAGGSVAILKKLIDHGAYMGGEYDLFKRIVRHEHTAMIELLLDLFIDNDGWGLALETALEDGLESMAQLLQQRGVPLP